MSAKKKSLRVIPTIEELRAQRDREIAAARLNFHKRVQKAKDKQARIEAETSAAIARMARDAKAAESTREWYAKNDKRSALLQDVIRLARSGMHHTPDIAARLNISPSLARALYKQATFSSRAIPIAREVRHATSREADILRDMYKPSRLQQLGIQLPEHYRDVDDKAWFLRQRYRLNHNWPNEYVQTRSALNDLAVVVGYLETNQIGLDVALGDPSLTASDPSPNPDA